MKSFFPAILWAGFVMTVSVVHVPDISSPIEKLISQDKLAHAVVYLVLTFFLGWGYYRKGSRGGRHLLTSAVVSSLYGVGVELLQFSFFPHRHFELLDIFANIIGSLLGLFALKFFLK